jgi:hypothetical protein
VRNIFVRFLIVLQAVQIPECAISWALAIVFLTSGHMHLQAVSPSFSTRVVTPSSLIRWKGKLSQAALQVFKSMNTEL